MWQDVEQLEFHEYKGDGKEDEYKVLYTCVDCLAKERGLSEEAAMAEIKLHDPNTARIRSRTYKWAQAGKRTDFEFVNASSKEKRKLKASIVEVILAPACKAILLKRKQLEKRLVLCDKHEKLRQSQDLH